MILSIFQISLINYILHYLLQNAMEIITKCDIYHQMCRDIYSKFKLIRLANEDIGE